MTGRWLLGAGIVIGLPVLLGLWFLSAPNSLEPYDEAVLDRPNIENGEQVFWAGGCASCHAAKNAEGDDKLKLGGGHPLNTPFGTFITPNISPDKETGIGNWSYAEFRTAMRLGVSPSGKHYYPSFPYNSYWRMTDADIADLFAYLSTLPPIVRHNDEHQISWMYQWRRPLGLWKEMFLNGEHNVDPSKPDAQFERGRYLVEALGHCGECHTPRNILGGLDRANWLAGGPAPEGEGKIPNITPHANALGGWSEEDIVYYLESGFTPDFDSVGGTMVEVQLNMAKLPKSDLEAIAAYLKAVAPVPKR